MIPRPPGATPFPYPPLFRSSGSNNVTGYTLDASGNVSGLQFGSPFAAGSFPLAVAVNAAGTRLYRANPRRNNMPGDILDASGNFNGPQPGSPFAPGAYPLAV